MKQNHSILKAMRKSLVSTPAAFSLSIALVLAQASPSFAVVSNTVTVTATQPGGTAYAPSPTATETVDVADDAPAVTVLKAHTLAKAVGNSASGAEVGDTINYTYTVTNSGNVTVKNVTVADQHDYSTGAAVLATLEPASETDNQPDGASAGQSGDSSDGALADGTWDTLGKGDVVVFTASYVVLQADLNANGGGVTSDGDIDNTATAFVEYDDGNGVVTVNDTSSDSVPLYLNPLLTVTKVADDDTDVVAGQVITYTYTVKNDGNVDMTAISLSDTHKGVLGALTPVFDSYSPGALGSTNTGNLIDILKPGDSAIFTATYTVLQSDIDTLQAP
jgi:large repetitive protein